MQILFERSSEGKEPGLGIVAGTVERFAPEPGITIPHMGWNQLELVQPNCPLWSGLGQSPWAYFVHSYYCVPQDSSIVAAVTTHGSQRAQ
jgi:glutamine amidotransferase